jgi:integrase
MYRLNGKMVEDVFRDPGKPADVVKKAAYTHLERMNTTFKGREADGRALLERQRAGVGKGLPTFREWATRYLDQESGLLTGIEPYTRHNYQRYVEQSLNPILGDYPIDAIDKTLIGKWVGWQESQLVTRGANKGNRVSAKTVKNRHGLLSNILRAAVDNGLRPDNPAYRTRLSKGLASEAVFLSVTEYNAVYAAIKPRWKPLVAFLVGSQCRISEALSLTWGDVNRDTTPPTIRVMKAWKRSPGGPDKIGTTKTDRGRRTVALWPALITELGQPGSGKDFVFHNTDGGRIPRSTFAGAWKRAVDKSGIGQTPRIHDLRHTGASWLIADGVPLPFIQQRLGHANITTTVQTYGHLLPDAHTRMSGSLEAIMTDHKAIEQ